MLDWLVNGDSLVSILSFNVKDTRQGKKSGKTYTTIQLNLCIYLYLLTKFYFTIQWKKIPFGPKMLYLQHLTAGAHANSQTLTP